MRSAGRPRVLLHAFSTFKLGGPQARFVQLAHAFGPDYHHVIVAMDGNFAAAERLDSTVSWEVLAFQNQRGGGLANRGALRTLLRQRRPDLLLTYNWGAIEWAAANLPRVVEQVHVEDGFGPEEATTQLPRRVWMRRALLGWPRRRLVVPSATLHRIASEVWRHPAHCLRFIPNGVAVPEFSKVWESTAQAPLRIGTLAALRSEKNIGRLLRAFAALEADAPARLIVLGDGSERPQLEREAQALGIADRVEFRGHQHDPMPALRELDLFALSSDTEQLPISLLEALALGIPAVGTQVGDVRGILDRLEPGWTCAPDDEAFAALLKTAVARRADWARIGTLGRSLVQSSYSRAAMLKAWREVFDGSAP